MRRRLAFSLLVAGLGAVATGCGGGGSSYAVSDARAETLSYFPASAPLVVELQTTGGSQAELARSLVERLPGVSEALTSLRDNALGNVGYDNDVRPLLVAPVAIGYSSQSALRQRHPVLAVVAPRPRALLARVESTGHFRVGSRLGATLWEAPDGRATIALRGSVAIMGATRADAVGALRRHVGGGSLTPVTVNRACAGLPGDSVARAYGNVASLLGPGSGLRQVPWVAGLRTLCLAVTAHTDSVTADLRLDTRGAGLSDADVPIAQGRQPPLVASGPDLTIGIRNPAHLAAWLSLALQAARPALADRLQAFEDRLRVRTGVDVAADLLGRLGPDATIDTDLHTFMVRAGITDDQGLRTALHRITPHIGPILTAIGVPGIFTAGRDATGLTVLQRDALPFVGWGDLQGTFVAGNTDPDALSSFADGYEQPSSDAQGSVSLSAQAPALRSVMDAVPALSGMAAGVSGARGWLSASTEQLLAHLEIDVG